MKLKKNQIARMLKMDIQAYYRLERRYPELVAYAIKGIKTELILSDSDEN